MTMKTAMALAVVVTGCSLEAPARAEESLNSYILRVIGQFDRAPADGGRRGGGYNLKQAFTQDIRYGGTADNCCIFASKPKQKDPGPNPTMCVAGVAEILAEAINLYAAEHKNQVDKIYADLPRSTWTSGNLRSLRANLFMYKGTGSLGTAFALRRAGIGGERPFKALEPGDVINFNRTSNTGHAVIFIEYIGPNGPTKSWSRDVKGFRYYSAQGMNRPDGGFGYRNAYFVGSCPSPRGRDDDCNLMKGHGQDASGVYSQNNATLNTGRAFAPPSWDVAEAKKRLEKVVTKGFEDEGLTRGAGLEEAVLKRLDEELTPDLDKFADGSETQ